MNDKFLLWFFIAMFFVLMGSLCPRYWARQELRKVEENQENWRKGFRLDRLERRVRKLEELLGSSREDAYEMMKPQRLILTTRCDSSRLYRRGGYYI